MCFSANASFGASAVLLTIGVIAVKKSQNTPQKLLAAVPLIFSVQQFTEGVLWLTLSHPRYYFLHNIAMYLFLFFAQTVWPVIVPLAVLLLEKGKGREKILAVFLVIGALTGCYLFYCLLVYRVDVVVESHHIRYVQHYPLAKVRWGGLFYFVPTVVSSFISSVRPMRLFGAAMLLSFVVSRIFYTEYVVSIWCYFAAILSVLLVFIITRLNRKPVVNAGSAFSGGV